MRRRDLVWLTLLAALRVAAACTMCVPALAATEPLRQPMFGHMRQDGDESRAGGGLGSAGVFLSGRAALTAGDFEVAAERLRAAFASAPGVPEAGEQALVANLLAGRPEADLVAAQLAQLVPDDPLAQLHLAGIEAARGNWAAAAQRYAAMPQNGMFGLMRGPLLAWAQFGAGRRQPVQAGNGAGWATLFQSALMADLAGRSAEAARLYKAAQAGPGAGDFDLARALASLQARQGNTALALRTLPGANTGRLDLAVSAGSLRTALAQRPVRDARDGIAMVMASFADLSRLQHEPRLGSILARMALSLRPEYTLARLAESDALAAANRQAAALDALAPVADNDPLAPSAALQRARLQDRLGRPEIALNILAGLEAAVPDRPEPWALQGAVLHGQQRDTEASAAYTKALALEAASGGPRWQEYFGRGLAEEAGAWPAAEADFRKALALAPDEPALLTHIGLAWSEHSQDSGHARQLIAHAAALRPDDATIADALGRVALREGDVAAAVQALAHAVTLAPEDAAASAHLGEAYLAAGRRLEAVYEWNHALALGLPPDAAARVRAGIRDAVEALRAGAQ